LCNTNDVWKINSWSWIPTEPNNIITNQPSDIINDSYLERYLLAYGPYLDDYVIYSDFYFYKSGVYFPLSNATNTGEGHGSLVVGYGQVLKKTPIPEIRFPIGSPYPNPSPDELYLSMKNSWGTGWGENGFFQIFADVANDSTNALSITSPLPPSSMNATCQDLTGKGQCYWGLGPKPTSGCPTTCANDTVEYCNYGGLGSPTACVTSP
jgi:hypothetical protein